MSAALRLQRGRTPPESPPTFDGLTPESVAAETELILARSATLRDQLASTVLPSTATFANLVRPLIDDENRAACRLRILGTLLASVSPDAALREASREAQKQILAAEAANLMRRDIAGLVAGVSKRSHADVDLDAQDRYLLTRVHGEYLRSGAGIQDDTQRARLQAALVELNELRIAAQKAFTEADDGVWFSRSELEGVPEETLATMTVAADEGGSEADDRLRVTFRKNHLGDAMRHALSGETRRKLYVAKQHRFPENIERLAKMVVLKDEIARLLRFENYAALKMEEKMAHSVGDVEAHLHEVRKRMEPLAKKETERLLLLKKKDIASRRDNSVMTTDSEDASTLYVWDWAYYSHKQRKGSDSINTERLAQYFEVMHTIKEMLGVFERLFGMEFEKIETSVWHEDVMVYSVWDSVSEGGGFLGYLYLDLVAREGKYRGAHHLLIRPGFTEGDGSQHYPASALVCSFTEPTPFQPTLLKHNEVRTMFHELGHAIHNIVARTKYSIPHSRDFIEIPSLMLENWTWIPEVLTSLGKHYTCVESGHTTRETEGNLDVIVEETLPRSLAEDLARTKSLNEARSMLLQIQAALFDLTIHMPTDHKAAMEMDITGLWHATRRETDTVSYAKKPNDLGFGQAQFPHIFRKYDAGYFAYPISMVYAADLYKSGFAKDPLSSAAGRRYRYLVLQPGSSQSEAETLENFLRRKPSSEAYFDAVARDWEL